MAKKFNPYHQWLGISKKVTNPTYYQLLGISPKEKDQNVIRLAVKRQSSFVEGFRSGAHAAHAKRLLYQIDQAQATLLNSTLRHEYDQKLKLYEKRRGKSAPTKGNRSLGTTRAVYQDSGLSWEMLKIMAVLIGGFLVLATITFFLPWERFAANKKQEEPSFSTKVDADLETSKASSTTSTVIPDASSDSAKSNVVAAKPIETATPSVDASSADTPDVEKQKFPKPIFYHPCDSLSKGLKFQSGIGRIAKGRYGKGLRFVKDEKAVCDVKLPVGNSPRSLAVWVKNERPKKIKKNIHFITYGPVEPSKPFGLMEARGNWKFFDYNGGLRSDVQVDREWHHHAITFDGQTITYYLDGGKVAAVDRRLQTNGGPLVLGSLNSQSGLVGLLDELYFFDTPLNEDQIRSVMNYQGLVAIKKTPSLDQRQRSKIAASVKRKPAKDSGSRSSQHAILRGHKGYVPHVVVSPDGKLIASGGNDKTIRIWDIDSGEQLDRIDGFNTNICGLAFSLDGKYIWGCDKNSVKKIEVELGRISEEFTISEIDGLNFNSVAFSEDCSRLICKHKGFVQVYGLNSQKKRGKFSNKGWIPTLEFARGGKQVFCGGNNNSSVMTLRSARDGKMVAKFKGLRDRTLAIRLAPNDKYVAATSGRPRSNKGKPVRLSENEVIIWNDKAKIVQKFRVEKSWQWALAFTPDSSRLITGGGGTDSDWFGHNRDADRAIRIWDISTKRMVTKLEGHGAAVLCLAVTPDGKKIVSGSSDSTIRIWPMP